MSTLAARLPAVRRLKLYELALIKWKQQKGLEGLGGSWSRTTQRYAVAECPKPSDPEFDLSGELELKLAGQIRKQILERRAA